MTFLSVISFLTKIIQFLNKNFILLNKNIFLEIRQILIYRFFDTHSIVWIEKAATNYFEFYFISFFISIFIFFILFILFLLRCNTYNSISEYSIILAPLKWSKFHATVEIHNIWFFVPLSTATNMPPFQILKRKKNIYKKACHTEHVLRSIIGSYNISKYFMLIKPEYWISCSEGLTTLQLFCLLDKKTKLQ